MKPSPEQFWSLVDELQRGREQGRITLLEAVEQVFPTDEPVKSVIAGTTDILDDFTSTVSPGTETVSHERRTKVNPMEVSVQPKQNKRGCETIDACKTFETFVIGYNKSPYRAALAAAQSPGESRSTPLWICGFYGTGKSHLLLAIAHHIATRRNAKVTCVTSEQLANDYLDCSRTDSLAGFRKKYRETDALLVDDIQLLDGKYQIQRELLETLKVLHRAHKQIVVTSNCFGEELRGMAPRLLAYLESGCVADLQPPDVEMRLQILNMIAESKKVSLPDQILSFLANRIRTNFHNLNDAITRLALFTDFTAPRLSVQKVEKLCSELLKEEGSFSTTIETIQKKVAEHFHIRPAEMTEKCLPESKSLPRQLAIFLAHNMVGDSPTRISEAFARKDYRAVLRDCAQVRNRLGEDSNLRKTLTVITKELFYQISSQSELSESVPNRGRWSEDARSISRREHD